MTVNPALFVEAPIFQSYLVDVATGEPMSAGVVTLYSDASHTILKNWYYQVLVGTTPTYVALPNPLTLSAVGTIVDGAGNNVQPLFYPYNESDSTVIERYYITVDNSGGTRQFTVDYFPTNVAAASGSSTSGTTLTNLMANNVFWRNAGTVNTSAVTSASVPVILSPDNHDGFIYNNQYGGDWQFFKDAAGATDSINFLQFGDGAPLDATGATANPQYYMNFTCSVAAADTYKIVQVPIQLHLKSLQLSNAVLTFWARCNSGASSLALKILGYTGSGTSASITQNLATKNPPNTWTRYIIPFTFPSSNPTIGVAGDDAWYLQFSYPAGLAAATSIDIALPTINMGNTFAVTSASTYDQVDAIINSPRTGDVRTSININSSFASPYNYFGWVPMNDGTIGNASSNATARANQDTWPLFNLIYNYAIQFQDASNGNRVAVLVNSAGTPIAYSGSAISNFNANNAIFLTKMFGRALLGTVPVQSMLSQYIQSATGSNAGGNLLITVVDGTQYFNGQAIRITGSVAGNLPSNNITYVCNLSGNTFNVAISYANFLSNTIVAYSSNGGAMIVTPNETGAYIGAYTDSSKQMTAGAVTISQNNMQPSDFYNIYMKL